MTLHLRWRDCHSSPDWRSTRRILVSPGWEGSTSFEEKWWCSDVVTGVTSVCCAPEGSTATGAAACGEGRTAT
eukprot:1042157-Rhodomonas_salina.1